MFSFEMDDTTARRPSEAVFANYELVENILSHLPSPIELGKAQQVNRHFNTVMKRSKLLRQRLFLELEPGKTEIDKNNRPTLNPVLRCSRVVFWSIDLQRWKLLLKYCDFKRLLHWQPGEWETMFISQPPIKKLIVKGGSPHHSVLIEDPGGVRLGALVQLLREWEGTEDEISMKWSEFCSDCSPLIL